MVCLFFTGTVGLDKTVNIFEGILIVKVKFLHQPETFSHMAD